MTNNKLSMGLNNNISSRVEKEVLINQLLDNKVALTMLLKEKYEFTAYITSFDTTTISFKHNCKLPLIPFQKIDIIFFIRDNRHMFTTTIKTIVNTQSFIARIPDTIVRNIQRRYERKKIDGPYDIEIEYKGKTEKLDFSQTTAFKPFTEDLMNTPGTNDVSPLVQAFRKKMSVFTKNAIVMFRQRKPQTLEEFLIVKTGKAFYIPNSFKYFPDSQIYDAGKIITADDISEYEKLMGTAENVIPQKINQLLISKQKKSILSELYYPVIYKKYVIGFLYIMNSVETNSQIAFNTLNNLDDFSKMLIVGLIKSSYFSIEQILIDTSTLVDISGGGVLFSTSTKEVWSNLFDGEEVTLKFRFDDSFYALRGEVRRRWIEEEIYYYGIQFMDSDTAQMEKLKASLYSSKAS